MNRGWLKRLAQLFRLPPGQPRSAPKRPGFLPRLEMLEDRLAPATFTVNVATDAGNNANPDAGSLRAAILSIDAGKDINAGTVATVGAYGVNDTIIFKIGTGTKTIAVTDDLPAITKPVAIDGSQGPAGQKLSLIHI